MDHKKKKHFKIKKVIGILFSSLILMIVLGYVLLSFTSTQLRKDGAIIELSRASENLLIKTAYYTSRVVAKDNEAKAELKNLADQFQDKLDIMANGRNVVIQVSSVNIDAVDGDAKIKLSELSKAWSNYRQDINIMLQQKVEIDTIIKAAPTKENILYDDVNVTPQVNKIKNPQFFLAYHNIIDSNNKIQQYNKELTDIFVSNYLNSQFVFRFVLFMIVFFLLVALVFGYFYVVNNFIKPINEMSDTAEYLAKGDFSKTIEYQKDDELGELSQNINRLVGSLKESAEFAKSIGKFEFEFDFEAQGKKDVLGHALMDMRDNLMQVADEDKKRNWANEGLARFVDILRTRTQDINDLSYGIISNLVNYVNANQGGLFVMVAPKQSDDEEKYYLELKASFAYDKQKFLEKRIEIGQGLIGQAVLEQDTLHIDKVPDDYIEITSGLGDATPKNLLIVPLIDSNVVYGAIEIASFYPFRPHEVAFVESLSENIASTLAGLHTSDHTQKLLTEAQDNALKLQEKDSLMSQTVKELASTQETMKANQAELQLMKDNLEQQVQERTEELEEKESQLSEALLLADLAPWKLDVASQKIIANNEFFRILRTNNELENGNLIPLERFLNIFVHDSDRDNLNASLSEAVTSYDDSFEETFEFRIKQIGGDVKNVALSTKKMVEEGTEETIQLYGTIQDITRQKTIEAKIRQQNDLLEKQQIEQQKFVAMVENATDFVLMVNMKHKVIYANRVGQEDYAVKGFKDKKLFLKRFFEEEEWERFDKDVLPEVMEYGFWEGDLKIINQKNGEIVQMTGNIVGIKENKDRYSAIAMILRDITEKFQAEKEREIANLRMKSILESTEDEIVTVDRDFNILAFNQQWADSMLEKTGTEPEVGMHVIEGFEYIERKELSENLRASWEKAFTQGVFTEIDHFQKIIQEKYKAGGREKTRDKLEYEKFYRRFFNPINNLEGETVGAVLFIQDITEQKLAEQTIKESEQRLQAITNSTTEGIVIHEKGYIKNVNPAFCEITGYEFDELIGLYLPNLLDTNGKALAIINMQLGYNKSYDANVINKNEEEVPVELLGRVVRFDEQKIRVFTIRNLTSQRSALRKLQSSRDMLQQILDTLPQSVFWKDTESNFLGCNQHFLEAVGLEKAEDIIGKTDYDVCSSEQEADFLIAIDKKIMETDVPELDILQSQKLPNGLETWLRISKVPFHDAGGNVIGLIGTYQDVTEQKRSEDTNVESKHELRQKVESLTTLNQEGSLEKFAKNTTEAIATTLDVGRVSIWEYEEDQHFKCLDLYNATQESHDSGNILLEEHFPDFFKALKDHSEIISEEAQTDTQIKELTEEYLAIADITSLMVHPIKVDGLLKGAIFCEQTQVPRAWTQEEKDYMVTMQDLMSFKMNDSLQTATNTNVDTHPNPVSDKEQVIYKQIIEKSYDNIILLDINHKVLKYNAKMKEMISELYDEELEVNKDWFDMVISEEDNMIMQEAWEELVDSQENFEVECDFGRVGSRQNIRLLFEPILYNKELVGGAIYIREMDY